MSAQNDDRTYPQVQAGTLEGDFRTPKGFLEWFYQGGGPGDQLDDVRTLRVCFWRVLESYLLTSRKHLYFGACLFAKNGIKNCIPTITSISVAQLSACFLCSHANPLFLFLIPPINKQIQIAMFGKFQVCQFSF